jgi:DNA-binding MarR family transcriptional regulator
LSPNLYQSIINPLDTHSLDIPPIDKPAIDTEFIILENIHNSAKTPLRQRDLAQIAGTSLGMVNSILKRLVQKGWITVKKLNSRNIQYAVTLDGIDEIVRRSYRYIKRIIRNVVYFKDILEGAVYQAKCRNISSVLLVGSSDLDFIVEYACRQWDLAFSRIKETVSTEETQNPKSLIIFAECILGNRASGPNVFYLSRLIIKQVAGNGADTAVKMGANED